MLKKFIILLLLFTSVACSDEHHTTHNPTPEEILSEDKDADIFLGDDLVYVNAQDIGWVNEMDLTVGEEVGKIEKQSDDSGDFEKFTASKLPVGTKIYKPEENNEIGGDIYIVKKDGKEIRYLGLAEG